MWNITSIIMTVEPYIQKLFWRNIKIGLTPDACWEWHGTHQHERAIIGYREPAVGDGASEKIKLYARRVAFEIYCGVLEPGTVIRSTCQSLGCCNPQHLYVPKEGMTAETAHGAVNGMRGIHERKLTPEEIANIRRLRQYGETQLNLARRFRVSYQTIQDV